MGVDVVGEGAGGSGPEVWKKLVFGVKGDDGERELLEGRGRRGGRGNNGDGGFDDSGREVLNWDIREWDAVDDFLKLEVDICILSFVGRGVLKLWA